MTAPDEVAEAGENPVFCAREKATNGMGRASTRGDGRGGQPDGRRADAGGPPISSIHRPECRPGRQTPFFQGNGGRRPARPIQALRFRMMGKSLPDDGVHEATRAMDTCRRPPGRRADDQTGAYRFRPDGKRPGLRVVVGRLATLKVDQASIAEAQFSLAA